LIGWKLKLIDSSSHSVIRSLKYGSFFVFIFLFIACAVNSTVETSGDKTLKNQKLIMPNHYIGISESEESFDSSFQGAITSAQAQIIQELGVEISVSITDKYKSFETSNFQDVASLASRDVLIEGTHNIQTRINRIYSEKNIFGGKTLYKTWVEVFFNKDTFQGQHNAFWRSKITALQLPNSTIIGATFINNYTEMLNLKNNRFEHDKRYISGELESEFQNLYHSYNTIFQALKANIFVQNLVSENKFSNWFSFLITDKRMGTPLPHFPITINGTPYTTDASGLLQYTADYNQDILIFIGHNLQKHLSPSQVTIYTNDTFSPMKNKNVALFISANQRTVEHTLNNLLSAAGYKISTQYDLKLQIDCLENTRNRSVNQYITELRLEVQFMQSDRTLRTIFIPKNSNEFITGYGSTRAEALMAAATFEYYSQKNQMVQEIERVVRAALSN